jgi:hypothetical protein
MGLHVIMYREKERERETCIHTSVLRMDLSSLSSLIHAAVLRHRGIFLIYLFQRLLNIIYEDKKQQLLFWVWVIQRKKKSRMAVDSITSVLSFPSDGGILIDYDCSTTRQCYLLQKKKNKNEKEVGLSRKWKLYDLHARTMLKANKRKFNPSVSGKYTQPSAIPMLYTFSQYYKSWIWSKWPFSSIFLSPFLPVFHI